MLEDKFNLSVHRLNMIKIMSTFYFMPICNASKDIMNTSKMLSDVKNILE